MTFRRFGLSLGILVALAVVLTLGLGTGSATSYPTSGFTIWTIAGNGIRCGTATGACGDGRVATAANLAGPHGMAIDGAGNVYIADSSDNKIRKLTPAGAISTIAGDGTFCAARTGPCGDGPSATSAQLNDPDGVAVDQAGNVYIADTNDNKIRKLTPAGAISTIAGNGTPCAVPTGACGDGLVATSANLRQPAGVTVDSAGNVYIADTSDNKIRKLTPAGAISTIAGDGTSCSASTGPCGDGPTATTAQLDQPHGLALDGAGDIFIADSVDDKVRKVTPTGVISTIAGTGNVCGTPTGPCGDGGPATSAMVQPRGVAVDASGNVYVDDRSDEKVREITTDGTIRTIAGDGTACAGSGSDPAATGSCGDGGAATLANLSDPRGVAVDGAGNVYVADKNDNKIRWLTGPQSGPAGPPGNPGARGAPGARGPAGKPGAPAALVLVAFQAIATRHHVTVRYVLTAGARITLTVKPPHGPRVIVASGRGHLGLNSITWNGKLHGKRAKRGRYKLTVTGTRNGHSASSSIGVRLAAR